MVRRGFTALTAEFASVHIVRSAPWGRATGGTEQARYSGIVNRPAPKRHDMGLETVVEVIADAAVRVKIPKTAGEAVQETVTDTLSAIPIVRTVQLDEIGSVTPRNDVLSVACSVQLTFHLDPQAGREDPVQRIRDTLEDSERVSDVMWFEPIAGPYRIEAW